MKIKINITDLAILVFIFFWGILYPTSPVKAITQDNQPSGTLSFFVDKNTYFDPEYLQIEVRFNSSPELVNTVQASIGYSPDKLMLVSVDKNQSFCDLAILETTDLDQGRYQLLCGNPAGELAGILARLTFRKLDTGIATVKYLENSTLLAADGRGTNILASREIANIFIVK